LRTIAGSGWTTHEVELVAQRGYDLHLQGKNIEALTIFEGLIEVQPRNVYCLDALAALTLAMGQPEKAAEYATLALALEPQRPEILARRCEAFLRLGMVDPATRDLALLEQLNAAKYVKRMKLRIAATANSKKTLLS
jgi:predicted Zn-dependent protease